jgi:hypothetical protein
MDGLGGTPKVCPLINQDGYSSEYFLDEGLVTYRAKVRHSRDTVKAGTQPFDRHVVTFTRFVKPTASLILGSQSETIFTIRTDPNGVSSDVIDISDAMSYYMLKAGGIALSCLVGNPN